MFSRLDPVLRTTLRETEKTDTWLGIRREENRTEEDGHKNQDKDEEKEVRGDEFVVSVDALCGFLGGLIESSIEPAQHENTQQSETRAQYQAARAASLYRQAAERTQGSYLPQTSAAQENINLGPEEKILIARLIKDLKILSEKGVRELSIGRTDSGLLEAFIEAAQRAMEENQL